MALFSLPLGVVADRVNRRPVMLACTLIGALAVLSIAVAAWADALTMAHIVVVALVVGSTTAFFRIAEEGVIARVVPKEQLGEAVSQSVARQFVAGLAGPTLGGIAFSVSRALPFLLDAISYLASFAALAAIRTNLERADAPRAGSVRGEISEAVRWVWQRPFLRDGLLLVAGMNFVPTFLVLIVVARERGASPTVIGIILASYSVGGLLGSLAASWLQRTLPAPAIVLGDVWLGAGIFVALALVEEPLAMGVLIACWAFVHPAWDGVVVGYRLAATPDHLQGRVASVDWLMSITLAAIGPLIAGYLLSSIGGTSTLFALAGLLATFAAVGTARGSLRHSPPPPTASELVSR
jgi:MFS family permease